MAKVWRECGYEAFADGTFGNSGQNIYVSGAGILQRIFHFDVNRNGYVDILFVNSQDMGERPPVYVYSWPVGEPPAALPTLGAYAAAVGDLNGDGYDDLVIANQHNGTHCDVTAYLYYGSPEGLSERYKLELPAPNCRSVAIGDFNGNGRPDLAFASQRKLRIFCQDDNGLMPGNFVDLDLEVTHLAAGDLDGDGCAELYVRVRNERPRILWGGAEGIGLDRHTLVGGDDPDADEMDSTTDARVFTEETWQPRILPLGGVPHLFRREDGQAVFIPVAPDRSLGTPLALDCPDAVAAAVGDVDGNGRDDLVVAVCRDRDEQTSSWIYWAGEAGFDNEHRTALPTLNARDVVVADLDGSGVGDVIVCQGRTEVLCTTESLIFRRCAPGVVDEPIRLTTHDARGVFVARTRDGERPQVIFINHESGRVRGDVSACLFHGGPDGFDLDRRQELPGWAAPDAACCDFNDDGWPDILISNCSENAPHLDPGSFLYWGCPDGFRDDNKQILPTLRTHGSAVGDFRRTGYLDLAVGGFFNPELLIFRGGPNGLDTEHPQRILMDRELKDYTPVRARAVPQVGNPELSDPRWLLAADFNKNGWLDLFVSQISGPRSFILWGGPEGFSMDRIQWLNVEGAASAAAADLTGNGWLDLVVAGHQAMSKTWRFDSYAYIYWGGPDGFREDRRAQLPGHMCNSLAIADLNNDGILDIFLPSYNAGRDRDTDSYIYWGTPDRVYSAENRSRLFTHSACGCLAADLNGNGWIDLAVACHKSYGNHVGKSQVWWNGPDGFSEKRVSEFPTSGPHGMLTMDFGNIMDRGNEEFYISSPFELPAKARVTAVRWSAETPAKTWVKAQIRFAPSRQALQEAPWQGPDGRDGWFDAGRPAGRLHHTGRWIQYRLALGAASGGSPRVSSVEVEYD